MYYYVSTMITMYLLLGLYHTIQALTLKFSKVKMRETYKEKQCKSSFALIYLFCTYFLKDIS